MFVFNFSCTSLSGARHSVEFDWRLASHGGLGDQAVSLAVYFGSLTSGARWGMTTQRKQWYFPERESTINEGFHF